MGEVNRTTGILSAMMDLNAFILLLPIVWPLFILLLMLLPQTRQLARVLLVSAALPAAALAIFLADTQLPLAMLLMGANLNLDLVGRVFLLLAAVLCYITTLFVYAHSKNTQAENINATIALLLISISSCFALILAGDAVLFFSASTVFAYSLYAMLMLNPAGENHRSAKLFLILLVLSDLLVFELLLLLHKNVNNISFSALLQALTRTNDNTLVAAILLFGFGIKAGLIGVHFWLTRMFVNTAALLWPVVLLFINTAGVFAWFRLFPFAQLQWPFASDILYAFSVFSLCFVFIMAMLQARIQVVLAYVISAATSLWLAVFAALLSQAGLSMQLKTLFAGVIFQSSLALTVLLCLSIYFNKIDKQDLAYFQTVKWISLLLLVTAPLALLSEQSIMQSTFAYFAYAWVALITLLVLYGFQQLPQSQTSAAAQASENYQAVPLAILNYSISFLLLVALIAAGYNLFDLALSQLLFGLAALLLAITLLKLKVARVIQTVFAVIPAFISKLAQILYDKTVIFSRSLFMTLLPAWRDNVVALPSSLWARLPWKYLIAMVENRLRNWSFIFVLLLLIGLLAALHSLI